jgi:hypothetical protein
MVPFRTSLAGHIAAPADAHTFLATVSKYAVRASGKEPAKPAASAENAGTTPATSKPQ